MISWSKNSSALSSSVDLLVKSFPQKQPAGKSKRIITSLLDEDQSLPGLS
jgi:hypothetical protein